MHTPRPEPRTVRSGTCEVEPLLVMQLPGALLSLVSPLHPSTTDVHTVASLLKLYLRELPEPVIPFARYEDFLSCAQLLTKDEGEVSASRDTSWGRLPGSGRVESGLIHCTSPDRKVAVLGRGDPRVL